MSADHNLQPSNKNISLWIDADKGVVQKNIQTPNDFVSHMIEHIAWRLGTAIDLHWNDEDWHSLGQALGREIAKFNFVEKQASAFGMIDDGCAEILVKHNAPAPGIELSAVGDVDLDFFLQSRCEQITNGQPLTDLLKGIAEGLECALSIKICSLEDPHHTWEGIFRAFGIALKKCLQPEETTESLIAQNLPEDSYTQGQGSLKITETSTQTARISRRTAESIVDFKIDLNGTPGFSFKKLDVAPSIKVDNIAILLDRMAKKAGIHIEGEFVATVLSSSHVVCEDIGMVIGRAYLECLKLRMEHLGVNGAGGNIHSESDFNSSEIRFGISTEGRKFWQFFPYTQTYPAFKKSYLIGHTVHGHLFSEDLDDFIDGFAGGSSSSLIIGIPGDTKTAEEFWNGVFEALGEALKESLAINPQRKGMPPGVKATLI